MTLSPDFLRIDCVCKRGIPCSVERTRTFVICHEVVYEAPVKFVTLVVFSCFYLHFLNCDLSDGFPVNKCHTLEFVLPSHREQVGVDPCTSKSLSF